MNLKYLLLHFKSIGFRTQIRILNTFKNISVFVFKILKKKNIYIYIKDLCILIINQKKKP